MKKIRKSYMYSFIHLLQIEIYFIIKNKNNNKNHLDNIRDNNHLVLLNQMVLKDNYSLPHNKTALEIQVKFNNNNHQT